MADLESLHVDLARLEEQVVALTDSVNRLAVVLSTHIAAELALENRVVALETTARDHEKAGDRRLQKLLAWGAGIGAVIAVIVGAVLDHLLGGR